MLPRIATRLLAEPWLLSSAKYDALITQFRGAVHSRRTLRNAAGLMEDDDDDDSPLIVPAPPKNDDDDDEARGLTIENGLAIISVHGILGKHLSLMETMCGGYDIETLNRHCITLMSRAGQPVGMGGVHTAIFHFNTPGGAAAGIADSAAIIEQLASTGIRTIAYCDEACSGGQWLAAACQTIVCGESAMMGSISALCAVVDESKRWDMEGLSMNLFTDGTLKGTGMPGTSLSEAQRAELQARIEEIGGKFKTYIRTRRGDVPDEAMQGQPFYGDRALAYNLADATMPSLQHCIAAALA